MQKKRKRANILLILLIPILLYVGYLFVRHSLQLRELRAHESEVQTQLDQLKQENSSLTKEVEYANTDSYIERVVREVLGWVKPGDIKFVDEP